VHQTTDSNNKVSFSPLSAKSTRQVEVDRTGKKCYNFFSSSPMKMPNKLERLSLQAFPASSNI